MKPFAVLVLFGALPALGQGRFSVEETTIGGIHDAIRRGDATCLQIVQEYVDRARAYNGICTLLVTADGKPVAPGKGTTRAGAPLVFPSTTVAIGEILPDYGDYKGLPIELGRMEPTQSDPNAQQQFGMVTGMKDAGQLNALSTLNLRGERSATCLGECDRRPSEGALPASCPSVCESFREQPDALERAAELDREYGRSPNLEAMPMYCVPFSFKDVFDTKDMRTTAGADARYAMDAAPDDATIVANLRAKGAIIYAKANLDEYNAGGGDPGGAKAGSRTFGAGARSSWAGTACNVYDTERETGGSSSGSASSVGANLVVCSICEETGGSCRQPAWRNGVVGFVTTKGLLPYGGSIGVEPYLDRAGIHCRTVGDAARVLDAVRQSNGTYYDPRDVYTALPKGLVSEAPYESFLAGDNTGGKPLSGMRIGVVREYMVKHTENDAAMSDLVNGEILRVLRDELGAEIVESLDPDYPDDPSIPNMAYNFQRAIAEILPVHMPEYFEEKDKDGDFKFAVPGWSVTWRDYLVRAAEGKAPLSQALNLRSINESPESASFSFHMAQYLLRRGDSRVTDWASLNANSKYFSEGRAVAMRNWEHTHNILSDGITRRVKMRDVMRLVVLNVMHANDVDLFVNPTITIPPALIGHASEPWVEDRPTGRFPTSANLGIPEITVPAGYNRIVYDPKYVLNEKKDDYDRKTGTDKTELGTPLPVGISFWAGPGDEPTLLRAASAYEAATKHRVPPPDFGPVSAVNGR
jgi:Asp-tRNA(Asn)/Glu-tRNA(Gln) amidotransferase A subunit family amidase